MFTFYYEGEEEMKMKKYLMLLGACASILLSACSSEGVEGVNIKNGTQQVEQAQTNIEQNATSVDEKATTTFDEGKWSLIDNNVSAIEKKVDEAIANGNNQIYSTIVADLEQIENEIEQSENQLEADFLNGSISKEDYYAAEGQFEQLENRLDAAEDSLEIKIGMND